MKNSPKKNHTNTHSTRNSFTVFFPDKSSWNGEQHNRVEMQKKTLKKELRKTIVETIQRQAYKQPSILRDSGTAI